MTATPSASRGPPPVVGWDAEAQDYFDGLSNEKAAEVLESYANEVVQVGNTRSHLLAAARRIRGA